MKRGCKLVVRSVNVDGRKFRPSDWIERISAHLATFGPDHRLHYCEDVQPRMVDGEKCLVINYSLEEKNPSAYEYIMKFVEANRLEMNEVCETLIEDMEPGAKAS